MGAEAFTPPPHYGNMPVTRLAKGRAAGFYNLTLGKRFPLRYRGGRRRVRGFRARREGSPMAAPNRYPPPPLMESC